MTDRKVIFGFAGSVDDLMAAGTTWAALERRATEEAARRGVNPSMASRSKLKGHAKWRRDHDNWQVAYDDESVGLPALTLKALIIPNGSTDQGLLVREVAIPWFEIMEILRRDPAAAYQIDPRKWEEIIAGAYTRAGFDEVILTPRSGDGGKDVIATKWGTGSIRIFDQVKAYKPTLSVSADDVRAMIGVITGNQNVSKGVITTTSDFAPRVLDDPAIAAFVPYRLELKPREPLLTWLTELSATHPRLPPKVLAPED